jgi:ABC-type transport system involved in cytochrome c biogenesis permease component
MAKGKFITHQVTSDKKHSRTAMITSNILLLFGSLAIVSPLVYLLFRLDKSDLLVNRLMPFIFVGIAFLVVSQLIYPFQFKFKR